jgi:peptidoglycan/LPS O-acetylase OafA/YrhL
MPNNYLKEGGGKDSLMRLGFLILIVLVAISISVLLILTIKESGKESPDYFGLAAIITAFLGGGVWGMMEKRKQKQYESENYEEFNENL